MSAQMKSETQSTSIDANVIDRRTFLKLTGFAGGGLMLAFSPAGKFAHAAMAKGDTFIPNGFIQISPDGQILIYAKNPEIGQGIKTTLPMVVAEELDADWADVRVELAPINKAVYGTQASFGSRSIPFAWDQLRQAGAVARAMLVSAAADEWGVPVSACQTGASQVTHTTSGRHLSYGDLATKAASMPVPDAKTLTLKKRSEYTLLGTRVTGVDNEALVKGEPLFGIDTIIPNMHYATYEKCPATGGRVVSANLDEIKALPGVTDAFILEGNGKVKEVMPGVAIVARSTWAAFQAKKKLKVEWDETNAAKNSWTEDAKQAAVLAKGDGKQVLVEYGDTNAAYADAAKTVESYYSYPFMAHATMEPQNCTAWVRDGMAEIWAPTQSPQVVSPKFFKSIGIDAKKVTVYPTRSGGGFGRRGQNDFLCESAAISKQAGVPVKLQYTREDDMKHDHYRPGGFHAFKGAIDKQGKLFDVEKIKTIGDAYMAVSGLEKGTQNHAENAIRMALGIKKELILFNDKNKFDLDIRIGINSGPVIGGVIGDDRFIYDLWGDAVNVASRMESTGIPGKIQISEATHDLVKLVPGFHFELRKNVEVMGRGEMNAYFVSEKLI